MVRYNILSFTQYNDYNIKYLNVYNHLSTYSLLDKLGR